MARIIEWRDGLPKWIGGRRVTVTVGDRVASGVVEWASWDWRTTPFVEFEDGTSIEWRHDEDATVTTEGSTP